MAARTTQQLVDGVRAHVGVYDSTRLRDGFDDLDEGEADHNILFHLNTYYQSLIPTGFVKCSFTLPLITNSGVYTFDQEIGTIINVIYQDIVYSDIALKVTETESLDRQYPRWRNNPPGMPKNWYTPLPRQLGIYPPPVNQNPQVTLVAETTPDDLVNPDDVPIDLFNGYHLELCFGAAAQVCNAMGGADLTAKVPYLLQRASRLEDWVQELAQQRGQNETKQVTPFERRNSYGRNYGSRQRYL